MIGFVVFGVILTLFIGIYFIFRWEHERNEKLELELKAKNVSPIEVKFIIEAKSGSEIQLSPIITFLYLFEEGYLIYSGNAKLNSHALWFYHQKSDRKFIRSVSGRGRIQKLKKEEGKLSFESWLWEQSGLMFGGEWKSIRIIFS